MSDNAPESRTNHKRTAKRGVVLGIALAVACHLLPAEHREICKALASFCTGGF